MTLRPVHDTETHRDRVLAAHNAIATAIGYGTSCGWEKGEVVLGIDAAEMVARMLGKVNYDREGIQKDLRAPQPDRARDDERSDPRDDVQQDRACVRRQGWTE